MIGVIADPSAHDAVREFFELFKTPWEFYQSKRQYDVLLSAGSGQVYGTAKLILIYAGRKMHFDDEQNIPVRSRQKEFCILSYQGNRIPIYGDIAAFPGKENGILTDVDSKECAAYLYRSGECAVARIGYDLFSEVRTLLANGQPAINAGMPALDLHIMFLRDLITGCGLPLFEIPPVPDGYAFTACLTHDIDHPSICLHKWDHTMLGFLYRATLGSIWRFFRGRMSFRGLLRNWTAALKLPFVHMGLARDFWRDFADCYLKLEMGLRSTFFVIPFKNCPGERFHGPAPRLRASQYGAGDIAGTIRKLMTAGCEVGLHGIDAWRDSARGRAELEELRRVTRVPEIGVRMHWLYYAEQSPAILEKAGAAYDSTVGYNETVGYRAGTNQAYKPFQAHRLLELPMHVMDTALFYPTYLGLSQRQAATLLSRMIDNAARFGGCFTVNWHDRSIAPERMWGACYSDLVQELKSRGAWFATAGQAVAWFQKRRSVVLKLDSSAPGAVRAAGTAEEGGQLPGLRLRIHRPRKSFQMGASGSEGHVDMRLDESVGTRFSELVNVA